MANKEFRLFARGHGVPLWRLAQAVGVGEATLTRWLRVPLSTLREAVLCIAGEQAHE